MNLVDMLKALGDETRSRIMNLLLTSSLCVCEIEELLNINQSNASRHLFRLKTSGLIEPEKQAQWVFYRINEAAVKQYPFLRVMIETERDQNKQWQQDIDALKKLKAAGGGCH